MTTAVFKGNPFGIDTDAFKFVDDIVHFRLTRRECLQAVSIVSRATVVVAALIVVGEKGSAWINSMTGTSHIEKAADTKALQVWAPSRLSSRVADDESKGHYQQAIADLNQALKLNEHTTKSPLTRAGMFYDIAWNYEKLGDKVSARQARMRGSAAMAQAMAMNLFPGMEKADAAKMVEQLKATANEIDPAEETAVPTTRSEVMTLHGGARMSSFDRGAMLRNISCYVAKAGALSLHGQLCEGLNMQDEGADGGDAPAAAVDAPQTPDASSDPMNMVNMNTMSDVAPNYAAESIEQPLPSQSIALTLSERLKRVRFPHFVSNIRSSRQVVFFKNRTSNAPVHRAQTTTTASAKGRVNFYRAATRPMSAAATQSKATIMTASSFNQINF